MGRTPLPISMLSPGTCPRLHHPQPVLTACHYHRVNGHGFCGIESMDHWPNVKVGVTVMECSSVTLTKTHDRRGWGGRMSDRQ